MINRNASRILGTIGAVTLALATFAAPPAIAQEHEPTDSLAAAPAHGNAEATDEARPVLPTDPSAWAGTMLIIIVAMFLMAAVIGPMVRMEIPIETHDDAHGHGHGEHGHGHADQAHGHH